MLFCGRCKRQFGTDEKLKSTLCGGPCLGRFHDNCTNLNEHEISLLKSSKNIKWFCDNCFKSLGVMKNDRFINIKDNAINQPPQQLSRRINIFVFGFFIVSSLLITFAMIGSSLNRDKNSVHATADIDKSYIKIRSSWLAQPPINDLTPLIHPIPRVIVMPTRTSECKTEAACTYTVRVIQTYNIESMQQEDIIYNFLIGGDGKVYEGRGWDFKGSVLEDSNDNSIFIAYIGSFNKNPPSYIQLNVTRSLLLEGIHLKKISPNYTIFGANQLEPTSESFIADALYKSFENWTNRSDK